MSQDDVLSYRWFPSDRGLNPGPSDTWPDALTGSPDGIRSPDNKAATRIYGMFRALTSELRSLVVEPAGFEPATPSAVGCNPMSIRSTMYKEKGAKKRLKRKERKEKSLR